MKCMLVSIVKHNHFIFLLNWHESHLGSTVWTKKMQMLIIRNNIFIKCNNKLHAYLHKLTFLYYNSKKANTESRTIDLPIKAEI